MATTTSSAKVPATSAKVPAPKTPKTPKTAPKTPAGVPVVCIGSKGCAVFPALFSPEGNIIPTESCHGKPAVFPASAFKADGSISMVPWKGKSDSASVGKALRAWVSKSGEPVRFFRLADAVKNGVVSAVQAKVDGNAKAETVYAPKGRESERLQYWGTDTRPGGRIETTVLDKRASGRADSKRFNGSVIPIPAKAK